MTSIVRSTVDAFTNRAVLTSDELLSALPTISREGGPPPIAVVPKFLHEATHHWCFSSTVGTAIAALAMRSQIEAVKATEAESDDDRSLWERRALEDGARATAAVELLRPLNEGFGLFSEFDLAPWHRNPVQPPPIRWAIMFYGRDPGRGERRETMAAPFGRALAHVGSVRATSAVRRRKASLLAEPLSCAADGGYLSGYLVLKNLWRFLGAHHDRFRSPDTFLVFAYDFFFEDEELVQVLLDPTIDAPDSLTRIAHHVRQRLMQAYEQSTIDRLEPFFAELVERRREARERGELVVSSRDDDNVTSRFVRAWDRVIGPLTTIVPPSPQEWRDSDAVTVGLHALLYGRDLFEIGETRVTITVEDGRAHAHVADQHALTVDAAAGTPPGSSEGSMHVFLGTRSGRRITALFNERGVVGWAAQPPVATADEIKDVERSLAGQMTLAGLGNFIEPRLEALAALRELTRIEGYRQQTRAMLDSFYQPPALIYVREDAFSDVWSKMANDGVYGLLDGEGNLVRALALFGILSSNGLVSLQLEEWLAEDGVELERAVEELTRIGEESGLFRLAVDDARVYCTL